MRHPGGGKAGFGAAVAGIGLAIVLIARDVSVLPFPYVEELLATANFLTAGWNFGVDVLDG